MDMDQYFFETQEEVKKIIEKIKGIEVHPMHFRTKEAKSEAIKALENLYDEFDF
jgi:hypothetical protein